jgi:hypothetical protein
MIIHMRATAVGPFPTDLTLKNAAQIPEQKKSCRYIQLLRTKGVCKLTCEEAEVPPRVLVVAVKHQPFSQPGERRNLCRS